MSTFMAQIIGVLIGLAIIAYVLTFAYYNPPPKSAYEQARESGMYRADGIIMRGER